MQSMHAVYACFAYIIMRVNEVLDTLSIRTGSALGRHSEGHAFDPHWLQQVLRFVGRIAPCDTWSSWGTALCRVGCATSQLDLPSLMPLFVAGCGCGQ